MAHIFKYPDGANKGIVVFTHKEFKWLQSSFKKKDIVNPWRAVKKKLGSHRAKMQMEKLSSLYYIGVHWGYYSKNIETPSWVDFHMSAPGTCSFVGKPFVIPLSSANFTPKVMEPKGKEKYWDIICVAKNDNKKKYQQLMGEIKKIFDLGYGYRVLFVIASNQAEPAGSYYGDIIDDYFVGFSAEERERFTIIKTHPDLGFQGFSYSFLSHLYNQSKVFTIFSQEEGGCKVIKEAQMCGLPVVVKSDMRGGGRDYLNSANSVTFDEYSSGHKALIEAVERFDDFVIDAHEISKELGEEESVERLKGHFNSLYAKDNKVFDGVLVNTDNLNRRLPAHFFDSSIVWASSPEFRFKTTDIVNYHMFSKFLNHCFFRVK